MSFPPLAKPNFLVRINKPGRQTLTSHKNTIKRKMLVLTKPKLSLNQKTQLIMTSGV